MRRIGVGLAAIVLALGVLGLYLLWPYMFGGRVWYYEPRIIGIINVDAGAGIAKNVWIVSPGGSVSMELVFQTKKGTAKGISILLDLGHLELVNASSSYRVREGRYQWRYTSVKKDEINITVRIPEVKDARYEIGLWYMYTNEPPVLIDNQTIIASLEPIESVPKDESESQALKPLSFILIFALVVVLLFTYWRRSLRRG